MYLLSFSLLSLLSYPFSSSLSSSEKDRFLVIDAFVSLSLAIYLNFSKTA